MDDAANWSVVRASIGHQPWRSYVLHVPSGDLYWDEPALEVALKCYVIACFAPFYTILYMAVHAAKAMYLPVYTVCRARSGVIERIQEAAAACFKNIGRVLRAVVLGVGLEVVALLSCCHPYLARRWIGKIENRWQERVSFRQEFGREGKLPFEEGSSFYMGACFQVRGNAAAIPIRRVRQDHLG